MWNFASEKFCKCEILQVWNFASVKFCQCKILLVWNFAILRFQYCENATSGDRPYFRANINNGLFKRKCQLNCSCLFVGVFCVLIQATSINIEWKCDFWNVRCLIYQVESIFNHFQKLEIFWLQKFPWNRAKMAKILQRLKTLQMCYS